MREVCRALPTAKEAGLEVERYAATFGDLAAAAATPPRCRRPAVSCGRALSHVREEECPAWKPRGGAAGALGDDGALMICGPR